MQCSMTYELTVFSMSCSILDEFKKVKPVRGCRGGSEVYP